MADDHLTILDRQRHRVAQATREFQAASARLYRQDGQPLYTDHQTRLDALADVFDGVVKEAEAANKAARDAAYEIEEREARVDPLERLTEAEATGPSTPMRACGRCRAGRGSPATMRVR